MRQQAIISAAAASGGGGDFLNLCLREKYISGWVSPPDTMIQKWRGGSGGRNYSHQRGNMFVTKHQHISEDISLRL